MNRKQRRAQATSTSTTIKSAEDIPLSQPDRSSTSTSSSTTKAKTLYEIAAEKQAELLPNTKAFDTTSSSENVVNIKIGPDGQIINDDTNTNNTIPTIEPIPPLLDTLFLTSSLTAIHFTLETLTVHQYAQELLFTPIIKHTFLVAFPTLFFLVHLFHGHLIHIPLTISPKIKKIISLFQQLIYISIANLAGCYLIRLTNDKGYYAVMKNAPSVGTIWVWAVIELGLMGALAGVLGPGVYAWWYGYGIF